MLQESKVSTENTQKASPLGRGKKEIASRYDYNIGPIIVFMGGKISTDDEQPGRRSAQQQEDSVNIFELA
jgi:hypothetical protein